MAKWFLIAVFALRMLPYNGALSLAIPEIQRTRACDGPCSPITEFIYVPCREQECFARHTQKTEWSCTQSSSARHDSTAPRAIPSITEDCVYEVAALKPVSAPHISQHILVTQKRE